MDKTSVVVTTIITLCVTAVLITWAIVGQTGCREEAKTDRACITSGHTLTPSGCLK